MRPYRLGLVVLATISLAKDVCVVVMQPGTVDTQLSSPFQGNVADEKLFSPAYSAERLLEVLDRMTADQSGSFVDWAGESIAW